jgi:two-component system phosphate regulon sensor histidine kinase PhoR
MEVDRLYQMVQELGSLTSIESGEGKLIRESFSVAPFIKQIEDRLQPQVERSGITLKLNIEKNLTGINADKNRIEQVLMNLAHNAIKFTPSGGIITIEAKTKDGEILFSVSDTGIGISREDLPRIFERFYKTDKARRGQGTGLGLSISKMIIEVHGGKIWAESRERKGSTFYFTLPRRSF